MIRHTPLQRVFATPIPGLSRNLSKFKPKVKGLQVYRGSPGGPVLAASRKKASQADVPPGPQPPPPKEPPNPANDYAVVSNQPPVRSMVKNSYNMVLIDGDGCVFRHEFIQDGFFGGIRAAHSLFDAAREHGYPDASETVVTVFMNQAGMQWALRRKSKSFHYGTLFGQFVRGFNQGATHTSIIDVGDGKEATDQKIRSHLEWHIDNYNCMHISLGGISDAGYVSVLRSLSAKRENRDKVTLIKTTPLKEELRALPFKQVCLPDVFREEGLEESYHQRMKRKLFGSTAKFPELDPEESEEVLTAAGLIATGPNSIRYLNSAAYNNLPSTADFAKFLHMLSPAACVAYHTTGACHHNPCHLSHNYKFDKRGQKLLEQLGEDIKREWTTKTERVLKSPHAQNFDIVGREQEEGEAEEAEEPIGGVLSIEKENVKTEVTGTNHTAPRVAVPRVDNPANDPSEVISTSDGLSSSSEPVDRVDSTTEKQIVSIYIESINKNNSINMFRPLYTWNFKVPARLLMSERYKKDMSPERIRLVFDALLKKFFAIYHLRSDPEFTTMEWDPETNMLIADTSTWDRAIESYPDAAGVRGASFPYYEEFRSTLKNKNTLRIRKIPMDAVTPSAVAGRASVLVRREIHARRAAHAEMSQKQEISEAGRAFEGKADAWPEHDHKSTVEKRQRMERVPGDEPQQQPEDLHYERQSQEGDTLQGEPEKRKEKSPADETVKRMENAPQEEQQPYEEGPRDDAANSLSGRLKKWFF